MSSKELLALRLLIDNPKGLYGSEFVAISKGTLGRASIYTTLDRLVEKGYVKETDDPPTSEFAMSRTRHRITASGIAAYEKFLDEQGLTKVEGAFAR